MKKFRTIVLAVLILSIASGTAFSQSTPSINDIQEAIGGFSKDMAKGLPFYSTVGLNWSDAYIGKLFPSAPPHFGIGLTIGATSFKLDSIEKALDELGAGSGGLGGMPSWLGLPLPAYTVDARLGGIILPFDIGIKVGYIPPLDFVGANFDYLLLGFDFRYSIVDIPVVKVSAGVGYNYLKTGFGYTMDDIVYEFDIEDPNTGNVISSHSLALDEPNLGFLMGTHTFELKAQVAFKLAIITPYVGTGLGFSNSHAGYRFKTALKIDDEPTNFDPDVIEALEEIGIKGISSNGFESIERVTSFNMRLWAGMSLNLAVFRLDLNVMYNLMNGRFGATIGTRIQI